MQRMMLVAGLLLALLPLPLTAQTAGDDDYTRYELPAPESASFRIVYDVTAKGHTTRLRIEETYTDEGRYGCWARSWSGTALSAGPATRWCFRTGGI